MKKLIHILLIMLIEATYSNLFAQTDTLQPPSIFRNATADPNDGEKYTDLSGYFDTIQTMLNELHSLYSAGNFHAALQLSQRDLNKPHLTKAQNQDRLKYTIASYKSINYDQDADRIAKTFLQNDPFYTIKSDDPVPFRDVLNNYYTTPQYSVWLAAGKTFVNTHMDTICSIIDTIPGARTPDYDMDGFVMQVGFEYRPFKVITISIAPSFTTYNIYRSIRRSDIATFHYSESCQVFSLPLFMEAGLHLGREKFVPSLYAGVQIKYIIQSKYTAFTEVASSYTDIPDEKNNTDSKNRLNYSVLGGIRLNYNHRRLTFFADLGVSLDLLPYNNPKKKYSDYDLLYQHFHVPDIFQMFEYAVKIGVKVNLKYKTIAKYNYGY